MVRLATRHQGEDEPARKILTADEAKLCNYDPV